MAVKTKHGNTFSTFFVTFTCAEWILLFDIAQGYDLVYNWFEVLKTKYSASILAYVIMPNHLHVILYFSSDNFNLNAIIANGKRFMAYEIIKRLQKTGNTNLLQRLNDLLSDREKKKGQLHKVFKDSFDAKPIYTQAFLLQKINYIHKNPVNGKWNLVTDLTTYQHSSASFYETGVIGCFTPIHYLDCQF